MLHVEVIRRIEQVAQSSHTFRRVFVPGSDKYALNRNFIVALTPPFLNRSRVCAFGYRAPYNYICLLYTSDAADELHSYR